jgi:hypothetical protein
MAKQESQINAEPEIAPKRDQRQELLRVAIWSFGAAVILVFLFLLNAYPGVPAWPYLHPISLLSQNMVMVLGAISFLLGGLLTVTRAIERADDELFFSTIHIVGGRHQSFGVIMIALTIVWYYLGFITYFILGIQNNNISSSVLKAYIAALAAVALVAIAAPAAATQLFLLGANFSFGLVLLGWVIGDIFRPLV